MKLSNSRRARLGLAAVLAVIAIGLIVVEPFPAGAVLVTLTPTHGVDAGDLPAVVLLLVAGRPAHAVAACALAYRLDRLVESRSVRQS